MPRSTPVLVAAAATLALMTAACATGSSDHTPAPNRTTTAAAPRPPITSAGALAVLTRYTQINNAANRSRDPKLNASIETGGLQAQSLSQFKRFGAWSAKDQAAFVEPFSYPNPTFYIPRTSSSPGQEPWFAAVTHISDSPGERRLLVFTQDAHEPRVWKNAAAITLTADLPTLATDTEGYVTALPASTGGLSIPLTGLTTAINDNFATGGKQTGRVFAVNTATKAQRAVHQGWETALRPLGRSEYGAQPNAYPAVYALKTAAGGALAIVSTAHQQRNFVVSPSAQITAGPEERMWVGGSPRASVTDIFTCLAAAVVPKAGAVVQVGYDCQLTDVR